MQAKTYLKQNDEQSSKCLGIFVGDAARQRAESCAVKLGAFVVALSTTVMVLGDDLTQSFPGGYAIVRREPKHNTVEFGNMYGELA